MIHNLLWRFLEAYCIFDEYGLSFGSFLSGWLQENQGQKPSMAVFIPMMVMICMAHGDIIPSGGVQEWLSS